MRSGSSGRRSRRGRQLRSGFAYVLLLVAVALIGVAASGSVSLGARLARRDAELQLLAIGLEMQNALRSYAGVAATATGAATSARGPRELQDLLKDPRAPGLRRHLRQIYDDPMTGKADWGLVRDAGGFITGVYSLAEGEPIRRTDFEPALTGLEQAESYREWVFGLPMLPRPAAGSVKSSKTATDDFRAGASNLKDGLPG